MLKALAMLSSIMSFEDIIAQLEEAINDYKEKRLLNQDVKKEKDKISFLALILQMHLKSGGNIKAALDSVDQMEEIRKHHEMFNLKNSMG